MKFTMRVVAMPSGSSTTTSSASTLNVSPGCFRMNRKIADDHADERAVKAMPPFQIAMKSSGCARYAPKLWFVMTSAMTNTKRPPINTPTSA